MAGYLGGMVQERQGGDEGIRSEERSTDREFKTDPSETEHTGREPPSSQMGYGGGNRTSELVHHPPPGEEDATPPQAHDENLSEGKVHGSRGFVGGQGQSYPRLPEDQPTAPSSENYAPTEENTPRPSEESGLGSSAPRGYVVQGGAHHSKSHDITNGNSKSAPESGYGPSDPAKTSDERRPKVDYGFCHSNSFPRDAGTGECRTGHQEEGGAMRAPVTEKSQQPYQDSSDHYGGLPVPTRPPGAVLRDEGRFDGPKYENEPTVPSAGDTTTSQPTSLPSGSLQEGEVRGVPHGLVSGHASGAGQDNHGASVKPQEYEQTGSNPRPDGSAYSQQYTQPGAPSMQTSQLEEGYKGAEPTPMERSNMAPGAATEGSDGDHKEGLMAKVMSHLPGHHKHHAGTNVSPTTGAEHDKPSFIEKIKDKLMPGTHHDTKTPEQGTTTTS